MAMGNQETGRIGKSGLFGGSISFRLLLVGLIGPPFLLFGVTIPDIRIAQNNGPVPRVLDWSEIKQDRADLQHGYVRASGLLTPTVVTETTKQDYGSAHTTNTYEILIDPQTHAALVVGHYGNNTQIRTGKATQTTVTGILVEPKGGVMNQIDPIAGVDLDRSCELVEGRTPGNVALLAAAAAAEVAVFLAVAAFAVNTYILRPRRTAVQSAMSSGDDWKKMRLD